MIKILWLFIFSILISGCGDSVESDAVDAISKKFSRFHITHKVLDKCNEGEVQACLNLGELSLGVGHFDASLSFLKKACDFKSGEGCLAVAQYYSFPNLRDDDKIKDFLEKACEFGGIQTCGKFEGYKEVLGQDKVEYFIEKDIEKGKKENLGLEHLVTLVKLLPSAKREKHYDRICHGAVDGEDIYYMLGKLLKHSELQNKYLIRYAKGKGNTLEHHTKVAKAYSGGNNIISYLNSFCTKQNKNMCYTIANQYLRYKKRTKAMEMLCSYGKPEACVALAKESLNNMKKNLALEYYVKAADAGDVSSFPIVVKAYLRRIKASKAAEYAEKCPPDANAYLQIGKAYFSQNNKDKAKEFFDKACNMEYKACYEAYRTTFDIWPKEESEKYRMHKN